jgi:hypothetical protein
MPPFLESFESRIFLLVLGGIIVMLVYAMQFPPLEGVAVFSVCVMVAGAALMTGGLLGFLFGIPRTVQNENWSDISSNQFATPSAANDVSRTYRPNTNLEQISDWLTKILVGVGLTQIPQLREELSRLINYLTPGLGGLDSSPGFAFAILVYFSICGFLIGYLITRLRLSTALREIDTVLQQVSYRLAVQQEKDANALALSERQLDLRHLDVPQPDLNQSIAEASSPIKVQIFRQAHRVRSSNWREEADKPKMERTIPIFRALVNDDPQRQFHRSRAELGFALKDKHHPSIADFREAEAEISDAIQIRGDRPDAGWNYYEFNRAVCRIKLYGDRPDMVPHILNDLAKAVQDGSLTEEMLNEPRNEALKQWLTQHGSSYQELLVRRTE